MKNAGQEGHTRDDDSAGNTPLAIESRVLRIFLCLLSNCLAVRMIGVTVWSERCTSSTIASGKACRAASTKAAAPKSNYSLSLLCPVLTRRNVLRPSG